MIVEKQMESRGKPKFSKKTYPSATSDVLSAVPSFDLARHADFPDKYFPFSFRPSGVIRVQRFMTYLRCAIGWYKHHSITYNGIAQLVQRLGYGMDDRRVGFRFPVGVSDFS
jgi:hypothetical protein